MCFCVGESIATCFKAFECLFVILLPKEWEASIVENFWFSLAGMVCQMFKRWEFSCEFLLSISIEEFHCLCHIETCHWILMHFEMNESKIVEVIDWMLLRTVFEYFILIIFFFQEVVLRLVRCLWIQLVFERQSSNSFCVISLQIFLTTD